MLKPTPKNVEVEVPEGTFLSSKTDTRGVIIYANDVFCEVAGYAEEELIGKPHNIVRHPDMPRIVFKLLWDTIKSGKDFWGYVKNLRKDGGYYWVFAHVTPSYDESMSRIIGYHSDRRRPKRDAVRKVEDVYRKLLDAERVGGLQESQRVFQEILGKQSYEDWVFSL